MLKIEKKTKECFIHIIALVFIVCLATYRIFEKPGLWFGDEFGYAGTAAYLAGMNWTNQISNLPYYGVGYGLLLVPAYILCDNAKQVVCYANLINLLMVLGAFELSIHFLKKMKMEEQSIMAIYLCGVLNSLYINNLVQLQLNWTESLNLLLYWLILCTLVSLFKNNRLRTYICLSVLLCFSIVVHMRNVGIVLSTCIILLLYLLKSKRVKISQVIVFSIIAIIGAFIFFYTKEVIQNVVWYNSQTVSINDVGSSVEIVKTAFSIEHIPALIKSILSKLFYAVVSTYGLVIMGIIYACKKILSKEQDLMERLIFIFVVLCMGIQLVIGSITNIYPGRVDSVIYGRYFEHCMGSLICLGIYSLSVESVKNIRNNCIYSVFIALACSLVAHEQISSFESTFNVYPCISGVAKYFAKSPNLNEVVFQIVTKATIIIFITFVLYVLIRCGQIEVFKKYRIIALLPIVIIGYMWINDGRIVVDYMLESEVKRYENINPISDSLAEYDITYRTNEDIYYFVDTDESWNEYLLGLQFNLGRNRLVNVSYDNWNIVLKEQPRLLITKNAYEDNDIEEMSIFMGEYLPINATSEFILYKHKDV